MVCKSVLTAKTQAAYFSQFMVGLSTAIVLTAGVLSTYVCTYVCIYVYKCIRSVIWEPHLQFLSAATGQTSLASDVSWRAEVMRIWTVSQSTRSVVQTVRHLGSTRGRGEVGAG